MDSRPRSGYRSAHVTEARVSGTATVTPWEQPLEQRTEVCMLQSGLSSLFNDSE